MSILNSHCLLFVVFPDLFPPSISEGLTCYTARYSFSSFFALGKGILRVQKKQYSPILEKILCGLRGIKSQK